ncbi:MAG: ABC transporter substrate-binding protein [Alphaproteobacteria bacterium]|nr:ABC transporter substrate-binding protein [Alphaproteobacteria bacterium]
MLMRYLAAFGLALALVVSAPVAHAEPHVQASAEFIDNLADRAIETLTDNGLDSRMRRDKFRELFREGFAVNGIARFVLGRYWRRASDSERDEYLNLFEEVIVNTWADRFSQYSGQKFEVNGAVPAPSASDSENVALVQSRFFTDPTTPVRIEWRVASRGNLYKIVDVSVEGISMASTQRDEFNAVIRKGGGKIDALLDELRDRAGG